MKKLLLSFLLIYSINTDAQNNWIWAKKAGGNGHDSGNSIATDKWGNVYVTGDFTSPTITFGSITLNNKVTYLKSDFFLAKYDANGNVLWAKSAGGKGDDIAQGITVDTSGNIYVTGVFDSDSLFINPVTLIKSTNSILVTNPFISKFDSNGNLVWAKRFATPECFITAICCDSKGVIHMTGDFKGFINMGTSLLSAGDKDIFIASFNPNGTILNAKREGSNDGEYPYKIEADAFGNHYVIGNFYGDSILLGNQKIYHVASTSFNSDIFIIKYNSNGTVIWAKGMGSNSDDRIVSIGVDASGNVFASGSLGDLNFAGQTCNNVSLIKHDSVGSVIWAKTEGGGNLAIDHTGNVFVAGTYSSPATAFGSFTLTNSGATSLYSDLFVAKYDNNRAVLYAESMGSYFSEQTNNAAMDFSGNLYLTGWFTNPLSFGNITLTPIQSADMFIAKRSNLTGINSITNNNVCSIFPNPLNPSQTLFINSSATIKDGIIYITNCLGQIVLEKKINTNSNNSTITLSDINLPSGIYYVTIKNNETTHSEKLIILN